MKVKSLIKNRKKSIVIFVFFLTLICIYYFFDPTKYSFFLKCPLKTMTGYECAGCGVQRAFHSLLHFRFLEAFKYNPLFVISIPVLVFVLLINFVKRYYNLKIKLDNYIFNKKSIILILIIVFVFSLLRNSDYYKAIIEYL
ncbi:Protein of unknown function [Epilithonimonas hungarica]|uniref:DUF2752 domain-containing protein n=1 Tax=Epilithonimonas hungarica TaxID=454006 RepID=A0A1G7G944_9FLAO|nr:Protein of unknown function [Epilithonimonas hungarica]